MKHVIAKLLAHISNVGIPWQRLPKPRFYGKCWQDLAELFCLPFCHHRKLNTAISRNKLNIFLRSSLPLPSPPLLELPSQYQGFQSSDG